MHYDLIIIGCGSVGASAGFYASRAGLKVLMVDGYHPPHQQGSHHGNTRLMRHAYGEGEKYVPLVLRAQTLWDELQHLSEERIFEQTGVVNLGPTDSGFLATVEQSATKFNLPLERLSCAEIGARWPEIAPPDNYIGLYEPGSGVLYSETAVREWIRLAEKAGCAQLFNCPVTAIDSDKTGITLHTAEGMFSGNKALVSAGSWVGKLLPGLPVTPVRKVFSWFQADGRYSRNNRFPAFTGQLPNGDQFYGFPAENDELKIGKHNGGQPINAPEERRPFGGYATDGAEAFPFLRQFLPGIGGCLHGVACTYDNSPDEDFIIDTVPGKPDVMVITGLSGHGFKFAPVLGEIATCFATGQVYSLDYTPFSLSRFG